MDDVGFLVALVDCVAQWLPIDRHRVYVAGISNGAMMTARLASEAADRFAAFAQVAGTAPEDAPDWWHPVRPVPVLQVHGSEDPILPYPGGAVRSRRRPGTDGGRVLGVDDWAALVTAHNAAADAAGGPAAAPVAVVSHIGPDVTIRRWPGRSPQGDVEFWRVAGAGHTWPGGIQYLPVGIVGTTSPSFDATAALWRFFAAHTLAEIPDH